MIIRNVCVYCGSSPGEKPTYAAAARAFGAVLAERRLGLIYGGGSVGLMGILADAVLAGGGKVTGVIPRALVARELAHGRLTDLRVTESMHQRKALMAELADAFVALPGGIGTFEELFEIWTWAQLGLHRKPCGVLNADGYYQGLVAFLDHATASGFITPQNRAMLLVGADPDDLLDRLTLYDPPNIQAWVGASDT